MVNIHNWRVEILATSGICLFIFYIYVYLRTLIRTLINLTRHCEQSLIVINTAVLCFFAYFIIVFIGSISLLINEWIWSFLAIYEVSIIKHTVITNGVN